MKDINKQIKFIDTKLLPLFGLENIKDYVNYIKCSLYDENEEKEFIKKINDLLIDIKTIFPVKRFNLHKTDNKIKSYRQAINILKMCLEIANITYTVDKLDNKTILRLTTINLFLYRYIEKMEKTSELRQNEPLVNGVQFLQPGTKEAHKTYQNYTSDDLKKQIKSTKTSHIIFKFKNFIKNNDGKKVFELPLNLLNSLNISTIKFSKNDLFDIKQNKIVGKYYILLNRYGYMIDGEFEFNKNLIPNDIIIPLNLSLYCDLTLFIPLININDGNYDGFFINNLEFETPNDFFINNLEFEIEFSEPIFYKSFQEKLLNEKDCFLTQEFDNKTLLYDFNQKDFIVQKDNVIYELKEEEEENDSKIYIFDVEYNINKIKLGDLIGYEFSYTPNIAKPPFLYALVKKNCAFIKSTFSYCSGLPDKYTKRHLFTEKISDNNYKHILDITFIRHHDTIGNINIIQKFENFEKIKVECKFSNLSDNPIIPITLKEKIYEEKNGFITNKSKVMYFVELENKQINLLNNVGGVTIRFTLESEQPLNIFDYIWFSYDIYIYETEIRKNITKLDNFFDPIKY